MRLLAALLVFTASAAPLAADTVYLVNGNKFEQVVAEQTGGVVRIRLPHGEIVLPSTVVDRVEPSRSVWQVYGERERRLDAAAAPAPDWLELALWADRAGHAEGMRQALLRAAELDPALPGLAAGMARLGRVLDREAGEWLTEAEYMHRRGYRLWGDRWLPREEFAARLHAREEAQARRREEARQERITRALEALVVAQLSRAAESRVEPVPAPAQSSGPLVAVFTGGYFVHGAPAAAVPAPVAGPPPSGYEELTRRQPGSLFPVTPPRHLILRK